MSEMICPRCGSPMRGYQRRDVTIEQCVECRGIFLDRGELERLTSAETPGYDDDPRDRRYDDDEYPRRGGHPRKRRGFLDDLLDFG